MSKEAEEFFRQKTIENAKRPRMKKFLALVNREAEGKIMQEYADQQLRLHVVSQQREMLLDFLKWQSIAYSCNNDEIGNAKEVEAFFKSNNCG